MLLARAAACHAVRVGSRRRRRDFSCRASAVPDAAFWRGGATLRVPASLHAANRARLVEALVAELEERGIQPGVVVLQGGKELPKYDTDGELVFRQESYFQWAFGVAEPGCFGVISLANGDATLLVPRLPADYACWHGEVRTPEWFSARYGLAVQFVDQMATVLKDFAPGWLHVLDGTNSDSGAAVAPTQLPPLAPGLEFLFDDGAFELPHAVMTRLRAVKTEEELAVMRYAAAVTSRAHVALMQRCKAGMFEYTLEAEFMHRIALAGCRHAAYTPIAASGRNAATLHYGHAGAPNDAQLVDGALVLADMGAEYHCYASDVTTTFPVSGRFTPLQAAVYNAVLSAQRAVLSAIRPGVSWPDMHALAERTLLRGLIDAGLLQGDVEAMFAARLGATFMPHGIGHLLGLDTHDVGGYGGALPLRPKGAGVDKLRTARVLTPGLVLTVEPGCYFGDYLLDKALADPQLVPFLVVDALQRCRGMGGVRLEDNVVVTASGCELLTNVPREVADVERVMAGGDWRV